MDTRNIWVFLPSLEAKVSLHSFGEVIKGHSLDPPKVVDRIFERLPVDLFRPAGKHDRRVLWVGTVLSWGSSVVLGPWAVSSPYL